MPEFHQLPVFIDAWIADTAHLTRAERGLYMDFLILCWQSPECRVPNDLGWIARKLRCTPDEMPMLESIIKEFITSSGNWLWQKRLKKEFEYLRANSKKQSGNAKSRWNKEKGTYQTDATWHQSGNAPAPTPVPVPIKKERKSPSDSLGASADVNEAIALWNQTALPLGLPDCQKITKARISAIGARLKEAGGIEGWRIMLEKVAASAFLNGRKTDWQATIDWVSNPSNFAKVMEGNYDDKSRATERSDGHAVRETLARWVQEGERDSKLNEAGDDEYSNRSSVGGRRNDR